MTFYVGIITLMCSFAIIAGGLVLMFVRYQTRILAKQRELHQLDLQYKQELLATSIRSAETERIRIAKDIHDEIGSIFSTLALALNSIEKQEGKLVAAVPHCQYLIQTGINSVRRISHAIVPFEIEFLGLEQALESYLETLQMSAPLKVQLEIQTDLSTFNEELSLGIYRIIQELCSNTLKYAEATTLLLRLETGLSGTAVILSYEDNGKGMVLEHLKFKKGIGLKNIESRVIALGGSLQFHSSPGAGFSCEAVMPLTIKK